MPEIDHVPRILVELLRITIWLAILSAIFVPLERLFALHPQKIFRKQVAVDLGYYFLNGLVPGLLLAGPMAVVALVTHRVFPPALVATIGTWPIWLRACAAMVVGETGYYWGHRLSHEIPFLWRFHAINHSAEQIDFLVSARGHPIDFIWSRTWMLTPLYALGLVGTMHATDGMIPILVLLAGMVWGYFVHANVRWRLGPFEWLLATPGFHHWHHTYGLKRNCNYASLFPWLDHIFGSHYLPKVWPARYGIPEPMAESLVGQLAQPLRESGPEAAVGGTAASG
jgi:sterol desaturase/sphingolipid hydroxylase (fatty acid hydroxylase superfamily)